MKRKRKTQDKLKGRDLVASIPFWMDCPSQSVVYRIMDNRVRFAAKIRRLELERKRAEADKAVEGARRSNTLLSRILEA